MLHLAEFRLTVAQPAVHREMLAAHEPLSDRLLDPDRQEAVD